VPDDAELAWQARFQDRFFDLHIHDHMQKIVGDRLRPAESRDPFGVEQAKTKLRTSYEVIDREVAKKTWAAGDAFTMADCAAAPALFYANLALPFEAYPNVTAYYQRLMERPSFKRAVEEAKPYFHLFPR
jgi:glutathione S-transferase